MISIQDLEVTNRFTIDFLVIQYTVERTHENIDDYCLNLLRSSTSEGDYAVVKENLKTPTYEDYDVNLRNDNIEYYYKIQIVSKKDGTFSFSNVAKFITSPMENIAFWLKWTYDKYLKEVVTGEGYLLLKKKKSGQLCDNYDEYRQSCRNPRCEVCWGTGFKGGYYPPIPISVSYAGPGNKQEQIDRSGFTNSDAPNQLWTGGYPIIDVGDILVGRQSTGGRHRVVAVTQVAKNELVISHRFTIQSIAPTDIVCLLPIENIQQGKIEVKREYNTWGF